MFDNVNPTRTSLVDRVSDEIAKIAINQLSPGEKLPNEFQLAQQLGVGRGTVREAVKFLVSRNILEVHQGKGTFVCESPGIVQDPFGFSFREDKVQLARDLLEARFIVEPRVAELAAQRATAEEVQALRRMASEVEHRIREHLSYRHEDVELHTMIARSTHNQVVPNLIPIINSSINMFLDITAFPMWQETIDAHNEVVEAIARRDPRAAHQAMTRHLNDNVVRLNAIADLIRDEAPGESPPP